MNVKLALTFDYGQTASAKEVQTATRLSKRLNVPHKIITLPWFRDFTKTALVSGKGIPSGDGVRIDDLACSFDTAKSVWVPNRNGILLNIAAGFAEGLDADFVIPGFNKEEAATFPDNTGEYLKALEASWAFSTATHVKALCYTTDLSKTEIVAKGVELDLPFEDLWPCYLSEESWCGKCESCQRFQRALAANQLSFDRLKEKRAK